MMGQPINSFAEGTPAWRVFFPALVAGWETLRTVLVSWGLEAPEVLDADTTTVAVRMLRDLDVTARLSRVRLQVSLKEITHAEAEADAMGHLVTSWVALATAAARYERRRRGGEPTGFAWLKAAAAAEQLDADMAAHGPVLTGEA